VWLPAAEQGNT